MIDNPSTTANATSPSSTTAAQTIQLSSSRPDSRSRIAGFVYFLVDRSIFPFVETVEVMATFGLVRSASCTVKASSLESSTATLPLAVLEDEAGTSHDVRDLETCADTRVIATS